GRSAHHRSDGPVRGLSQKRDIPYTFFADSISNVIGHAPHISRFQEFVSFEQWEGPFLGGDIGGCLISLRRDEPIEPVYELYRFFRTISDSQPYQHLGQPHCIESNTALGFLLCIVLFEKVWRGIDDVIEKPHCVPDRFAQILPGHFSVHNELGKVDCSQIAHSKTW